MYAQDALARHAAQVQAVQLDGSLSFEERRRLVRELRLEAVRVATSGSPKSVPGGAGQDAAMSPGARSAYSAYSAYSGGIASPVAAKKAASPYGTNYVQVSSKLLPMSQLDVFEHKSSEQGEQGLAPGYPRSAQHSLVGSRQVTETQVEQYLQVNENGGDGIPVRVTEVHHHHHHHHYYEPIPANLPGGERKPQVPSSPVSRAHKPPIQVSARKKAAPGPSSAQVKEPKSQGSESTAAPVSPSAARGGATADVVSKAQRLLDEAKRSEQAKSRKSSNSGIISKTAEAAAALFSDTHQAPMPVIPVLVVDREQASATSRRARSRTASVVLNEVEKAQVARAVQADDSEAAEGLVLQGREEIEKEEVDEDEEEGGEQTTSSPQGRPMSNSIGFVELAETIKSMEHRESDDDEEKAESESESEEIGAVSEQARQDNLMEMYEKAEVIAEEIEEDRSVALTSLGELANKSRYLKPSLGRGESRLPRFASSQDSSGPVRPMPQIQESASSSSRHMRAMSAGSDLTPAEKNGWMFKMPKKNRWLPIGSSSQWNPRYFRLTDRSLMYMNHEHGPVKGMLDLDKIQVVCDPTALEKMGRPPTPHAMALFESGRKAQPFFVCAQTFAEIFSWYRAVVKNACLRLNVLQSTPPPDLTPMTAQEKLERARAEERRKMPKLIMPGQDQFYPAYRNPASFYDMLGVTNETSKGVIRKKYYKLAAEFHPDKNPGVNPSDFQNINDAWQILGNDDLREKYDRGEKIKELFRRGFDCTIYLPTRFVHVKSQDGGKTRRLPAALAVSKQTVFSDGQHLYLFRQEIDHDQESEVQPLKPDLEKSVCMQYVNKVVYGRHDEVIYKNFFQSAIIEIENQLTGDRESDTKTVFSFLATLDCFVVLKGSRLDHDWYLKLDTPEVCKEIVEGLRIIRCEKSVLFAQNLEKDLAAGFD